MSTQHSPQDDSAQTRDVARSYDRWARHYDDDRNATRDLDAAVLRRSKLCLSGRDVLELGCGTGKNTLWLAAEARKVLAVDFSGGMLAEARRRVSAPNVRFIEHDVRVTWPVTAGSVDVVVCNLMLEHVHDLAPIYAEAARVLHKGGQLFISELHPFRQLRGAHAHFTDPDTGETVRVPAVRHSVSEYVNAGIAAGFRLCTLGEWLETDAAPDADPRLLSVLFERG